MTRYLQGSVAKLVADGRDQSLTGPRRATAPEYVVTLRGLGYLVPDLPPVGD